MGRGRAVARESDHSWIKGRRGGRGDGLSGLDMGNADAERQFPVDVQGGGWGAPDGDSQSDIACELGDLIVTRRWFRGERLGVLKADRRRRRRRNKRADIGP